MIITAYVIAALVGLGIIYIGVSYLFAPMTVAPAFGFRALPTAAGYYDVKGVRDIVAGLMVGAFMLYGDHRALALVLAIDATLRNALRMLNPQIPSVGNAVQRSEAMRNSLSVN